MLSRVVRTTLDLLRLVINLHQQDSDDRMTQHLESHRSIIQYPTKITSDDTIRNRQGAFLTKVALQALVASVLPYPKGPKRRCSHHVTVPTPVAQTMCSSLLPGLLSCSHEGTFL